MRRSDTARVRTRIDGTLAQVGLFLKVYIFANLIKLAVAFTR